VLIIRKCFLSQNRCRALAHCPFMGLVLCFAPKRSTEARSSPTLFNIAPYIQMASH
jgi:hypothetical protein